MCRHAFTVCLVFFASLPVAAQQIDGKKKDPDKKDYTIKLYAVPNGTAEALAKLLREIHNGPTIRIAAVNPNQIAVYADAATHLEIARQTPLQPPLVDVIELSSLDPAKTVQTLRVLVGDAKTGGPTLEAHTERHALIVRGSAEQVREVREILHRLGEGSNPQAGVRIINVDKGSAATLAEALQKLLPELRDNPVKIIVPGKLGDTPKKQPEPMKEIKGKKLAAITITAIGNRLIIATEDAEAMAAVVAMIRLMLSTETPQCDYAVVRLKNIPAADAARVLDEAFNKPGKSEQGRAERINVIAEAISNSVLLRASPLDMLAVQNLLRQIDVPGVDLNPPKTPRPKR